MDIFEVFLGTLVKQRNANLMYALFSDLYEMLIFFAKKILVTFQFLQKKRFSFFISKASFK